jgi:hypothetical protein
VTIELFRATRGFCGRNDDDEPVRDVQKYATSQHGEVTLLAWRDLVLFYEYFHGDNGAGLGASHQTGWTGIVARLMHLFATTTAEQTLELGKMAAVVDVHKARKVEAAGRAKAGVR